MAGSYPVENKMTEYANALYQKETNVSTSACKNLALIEETEVEFGPGLNILTGETGAGKSILLGSIQLILGGKTSRSMIRENASYALQSCYFRLKIRKPESPLRRLTSIRRTDRF